MKGLLTYNKPLTFWGFQTPQLHNVRIRAYTCPHTYNVALSPQRECNRCVCWHTSSIRPASDIRFRNKKKNGLLKDFATMEVDHRPSRLRAPWPVTLIIKHTMAYNTIRSSDDGWFISVRSMCIINTFTWESYICWITCANNRWCDAGARRCFVPSRSR